MVSTERFEREPRLFADFLLTVKLDFERVSQTDDDENEATPA